MHDFRIWRDLEAQFADFWGPFGRSWGPFCIFLRLWGRTLDLFFAFPGKGSKKMQKGREKGAEMDACSSEFQFFPENAKVRFDCAGARGLRFRPLLFLLCASIFALPFSHRVFEVFELPQGLAQAVCSGGGAPLNEFN